VLICRWWGGCPALDCFSHHRGWVHLFFCLTGGWLGGLVLGLVGGCPGEHRGLHPREGLPERGPSRARVQDSMEEGR
jgi:hypothetical protein